MKTGVSIYRKVQIISESDKKKYPRNSINCQFRYTDPNGERFDYLNNSLRALNTDFIDEHYYHCHSSFFENASMLMIVIHEMRQKSLQGNMLRTLREYPMELPK